MRKARRLMDQNGICFHMYLNMLSYIALGSESQISVFKQCQSITQMSGFSFLFGEGGGDMHRTAKIFSVKKILHMALGSVQFLTSFISFYFEILSYLACGEKIIGLAYKNSVKLGEESTSDF